MLGQDLQRAQPVPLIAVTELGTLMGLPVINRREVGMTSSPHGPYRWGYTRHTMAGTKGRQAARVSQSQTAGRSPDRSLQHDCVKSESLVIVDQHVTVNTCPGLLHAARHTMGAGLARSSLPNRKDGDSYGGVRD